MRDEVQGPFFGKFSPPFSFHQVPFLLEPHSLQFRNRKVAAIIKKCAVKMTGKGLSAQVFPSPPLSLLSKVLREFKKL